MTGGIPGSLGVPNESIENTLIGMYNDNKSNQRAF